jgi:dinuclear metal center YbgI/SA1388 family protein
MQRHELVAYLDALLSSVGWPDFGPNGLQVEGASEIHHVVTGVSACEELFVRAAELEAQAVLVHHGLLWDNAPTPITGFRQRRLRQLFAADLNLLAYHLPLDAHAELGNNALAARALGLTELTPFAQYKGRPIGWQGRFAPALPLATLVERCRHLFEDREPLVFAKGPDPVRSLGIVSGGAQGEVYQAISAGLDAYLTGEVSEWVMNVASENRITFLSCGHYATERLGIRALGEQLAAHCGLEVTFVDVPNPV